MIAPPFPAAGVVFDLDGVLIDSESANVESARQALAAFGVQLEAESIPRIVGRHPRDYLPELLAAHGVDGVDPRGVAEVQERAWRRQVEQVAEVPGAAAVVRRLAAAGLKLAVATSSGANSARSALERLGIADAFDALLAIEDVRHAKPDPEIYHLTARRLGLPPRHLVAVEDSPHGIAAARSAGLVCIALAGAWTPAEKLAEAQAVVRHLDEVPELLEFLSGPLPSGRQKE